jgi:HSP20 family molecular chaperone IbpA
MAQTVTEVEKRRPPAGERAETKDEKGKTFRLQERLAKQFERRFELPPEADSGNVAADFHAGVLTLHAPKEKVAEPRTVPIAAR